MAGLPGSYGPPGGAILIASVKTDAGFQDAGGIAVRPLPQKASSQQSKDTGEDLEDQVLCTCPASVTMGITVQGKNGSTLGQCLRILLIGTGDATEYSKVDGLDQKSTGRTCEMKRLYVRPQFQGRQLGRALCEEVIKISREMGYEYMVLDTLERLEAAGRMYNKLGFDQCPPYYHNPNPGVVYWRKQLQM